MSFARNLLLGLMATLAASAWAETHVGDRFPELRAAGVETLSGAALPSLAGKVVLVDFWASWCAPCKASFPAMARLQADYAGKDVVIVAVALDEAHDPLRAIRAFLAREQPPFVIARDVAAKLVPQVSPPAMPTSYLVDRTGRVRFVHEGFHGASTEREVRREIDALLAEPSPSS